MRTTLTIEDGVAASLRRLAGSRGVPLKKAVNDVLLAGLHAVTESRGSAPYVTKVRDLGIRPGVDPYTLGQMDQEDADRTKLELGR